LLPPERAKLQEEVVDLFVSKNLTYEEVVDLFLEFGWSRWVEWERG
jgi:hypothetical protein